MTTRHRRASLRRVELGARPAVIAGGDPRSAAAWRSWLVALATDAEAAMAAALAYESLDGQGRAAWLDALEQDAPGLGVPRIALYAPILTVEHDPDRLGRISEALGDEPLELPGRVEARALRGVVEGQSDRVVVLVLPMYLSFVQVFSCRYSLAGGFVWARHEPFCREPDAPGAGAIVEGVMLERTPMKPVIEELAHAVVAHGRTAAPLPDSLRVLTDLFSPEIEVVGLIRAVIALRAVGASPSWPPSLGPV